MGLFVSSMSQYSALFNTWFYLVNWSFRTNFKAVRAVVKGRGLLGTFKPGLPQSLVSELARDFSFM